MKKFHLSDTSTLATIIVVAMVGVGIPSSLKSLLGPVTRAPLSLPWSLVFSAAFLAVAILLFRFTRLWPGNKWGWIIAGLLWGGFAVDWWVTVAGRSLSMFTKQINMPMFSASLAGALPEEIGKFIGVLLIVLMFAYLRKPWHVFVVACMVGMGFIIIEDMGYAAAGAMMDPASDMAGSLRTWISRTALGFGAHSIYTAVATWGLGKALFSPQWSTGRKIGVTLFWFFWGFMLHFIWNMSLGDPMISLVKSLVMVVVSYGLFIVLFVRALRLAKEDEQLVTVSTELS